MNTNARTTALFLHRWPRWLAAGTVLATLALAGCDRNEPETVGERVDGMMDKASDKMDAAGARIEQSADEAKASMDKAADNAAESMNDTAITAAIKLRLAADDELKVLQIGVETEAGRAMLQGTAPNAAARERATQLAEGVGGVTSVDNQLVLAN